MTVERVDSPLAGRRPGPLGPVGGISALGGQVSSGPAIGPPLTERSAAPFWLELKGVERWFDTLDPSERLTLLTSLFGRSSEPQLRQFSAAIDKSLQTAQYATGPAAAPGQPPFASNLSRFGVGQPAASQQSSDYASLRYHTPMQKQPSGSGNTTGGVGAPGTVPGVTSGPPSGPPQVGGVNTSNSGSGYMSPLNQPLSAPLGNSQNPFAPSSDLYAQAFLPLPRSKSYTPWGPEIRPKSATADAWPDLASGRASPQPAQSSPNIAALSLEQNSASTSPIGHPIKPWRTFTPVGPGQTPESFDPSRASRPTSTQPPQPVSHPSNNSGSVLGNGISIMSHPPPVPPLNVELNRRSSGSQTAPHSATGSGSGSGPPPGPPGPPGPHVGQHPGGSSGSQPQQLNSHISAPFGSHFAARAGAQSTSPTISHKFMSHSSDASPVSLPNAESGSLSAGSSSAVDAGSPTSSIYTLTGKQSPKRGVNVVDVELLSDIGAWLRSLRLHKYTGNLAGMRWQDVVQLEDADLESRGVNALGARRKLLKMFEEIRQAQEAGLLPEEDNA